MNTFLQYLEYEARDTWQPQDLNEIILMTYTVLIRVVREQGELLTLTHDGFVWSREGNIIGVSPIVIRPRFGFREAMRHIIDRDEVVGRHIIPDGETDYQATYRLIYSQN